MASSKGVCKECDVCRLYETGVQNQECKPRCYEESPKEQPLAETK